MTIPNRIAFGSCNKHHLQNNMWPIIEKRRPAAFIWAGDSIYADTELYCGNPDRLRRLYEKQKSVPGYHSLLLSNTTIFGTYDDHDYGCNNADASFKFRHESGKEYLNFLEEPFFSPMGRRAHAGLGVYGVKLIDFDRPPGQQVVSDAAADIDPDLDSGTGNFTPFPAYSNRSVAIFVLDVRTNKSPWKTGWEAFQSDCEGDFLGEEQWQWFETAIRRSRASVNVITNGLQVHAHSFPNANVVEGWGLVPKAQQRLMDAVLQEGIGAPVLVSGDVHMAQLLRKDCENMNEGSSRRRSLVEMTTSGMTHSLGTVDSPPLSDPGQAPTLGERYERFVTSTTMRLLHTISPWKGLLTSCAPSSGNLYDNGGGEGGKNGLQYSLEKNFGEMEFDWEHRTVAFRVMGEDPGAPPLLMANWTLNQLSGIDTIPGSRLTAQHFADDLMRCPASGGMWACVDYRGRPGFLHQTVSLVFAIICFFALLLFPVLLPSCLALMVCFRRGNCN